MYPYVPEPSLDLKWVQSECSVSPSQRKHAGRFLALFLSTRRGPLSSWPLTCPPHLADPNPTRCDKIVLVDFVSFSWRDISSVVSISEIDIRIHIYEYIWEIYSGERGCVPEGAARSAASAGLLCIPSVSCCCQASVKAWVGWEANVVDVVLNST